MQIIVNAGLLLEKEDPQIKTSWLVIVCFNISASLAPKRTCIEDRAEERKSEMKNKDKVNASKGFLTRFCRNGKDGSIYEAAYKKASLIVFFSCRG